MLSEYDEHDAEGEGGGGGGGGGGVGGGGGGGGIGSGGDCGSSTEPSIGLTPDDESPSLGIPPFYRLSFFLPPASSLPLLPFLISLFGERVMKVPRNYSLGSYLPMDFKDFFILSINGF